MECNKEEAIRAREIAQKKMENQDFAGARKIALKSQRLYPDLENINQLICVCDVHCSAENKKLGNERDWYDILKVEQSADEMLIKKQYRKLALLLHPDKNKFSGAEAAFMLIGEAQKVLLDKDKRVVYDARYRRFFQNTAPNPPPEENKNSKNMKPPSGKNNMAKTGSSQAKKKPQQQADPVDTSETETFWTVCPFCSVRYRYRKTALEKNLKCQSCKKVFIAYDMSDNTKPGSKVNQTETSAQTTSKPGVPANSGQPSGTSNGNKTNEQLNTGSKRRASSGGSNHIEAKVVKKGKKQEAVGDKEKKQASAGKTGNTVTKKEKNQESAGKTGNTATTKEKNQASAGKTGDTVTEKEKNHTSASKKGDTVTKKEKNQVSAEKAANTVTKRAKKEEKTIEKGDDASAGSKRRVPETEIGGGEETLNSLKKQKGNAASDENDIDLTQPQHVPDNDFNDFDEIRQESCFKANQIWAVYDDVDTMPRFYAVIKTVFSGGSKLRIIWLDPDPDEKIARPDLPISCGKFIPGTSEITDDILMFSHPMCWEKGKGKNGSITIYPKKGETWALFRDWRTRNSTKKFEFEFVEIISDFDASVGVRVAFLRKLKGFSAIYCREGKRDEEIHIPLGECFRFSHRVSSFTMTGEEGKGVPKGCYELDLAAIPFDSSNDDEPRVERREPEFFNFDAMRDLGRFKIDQVWALYNDEDGLPKCYGQIKRVYLDKPVKLKIAWLNKDNPNCCGRFKITNRKLDGFCDSSPFSHELHAEKIKVGVFEIYPQNGQVWGLYKNLEKCDYDVVEIVESVKGSPIKVTVLEKVCGYNYVFKVKMSSTMKVPWEEVMRFSHQIPAHVLTDERDGSLRGFRELDPSALPSLFLPKVS